MSNWFQDLGHNIGEGVSTITQPLRDGYNDVSGFVQDQRARAMHEIEERAPFVASSIRFVDRNFRIVEHGVQSGVVEIGAGIAAIGGDTILNGGWEKITGERLFNGSVYDWSKRHLNSAIDGVQEIASLGGNKPLQDLNETEQNARDVISLGVQFALPAMGVASGVVKGRQIYTAAKAAHATKPGQSWAQSVFRDAVHFAEHPVRSTHSAVSVANSSKNSAYLGYQLSEETLQFMPH